MGINLVHLAKSKPTFNSVAQSPTSGTHDLGFRRSRPLCQPKHKACLLGPGPLHFTRTGHCPCWSCHGPGISIMLESPLQLRLYFYQWLPGLSTGTPALPNGAELRLFSVTLLCLQNQCYLENLTHVVHLPAWGISLGIVDHSFCVLTLRRYCPDFASVMLIAS